MQTTFRSILTQSLRTPKNVARNVFGGAKTADPRVDHQEGVAPFAITHLSESEIFLKDTDVVKPLVRKMDAVSKMDPEIIKGCFENGFMGPDIPEEYEGPGTTFFDVILIVEELAKVDPAVSVMVDVHNTLVVDLILEYGTEEQKKKYLPHLCQDWVFANADPPKGYKGITCFFVDRDSPGLSLGKPEDKLGIRASSTCPVHLDNGVQYQIADMATDIEAARLMVYNAARLKQANLPYIKESAMAKLYASNVATKVSSRCVELMGGVGFTKDFPIEKFYRDCKIGTIYEGTSNIQLSTIAKFIDSDYQQ